MPSITVTVNQTVLAWPGWCGVLEESLHSQIRPKVDETTKPKYLI